MLKLFMDILSKENVLYDHVLRSLQYNSPPWRAVTRKLRHDYLEWIFTDSVTKHSLQRK